MAALVEQIEGGRRWFQKPHWLDSEEGNFRILRKPNSMRVTLVAHSHEDAEGHPLRYDFDCMESAMEYAEKM